MISDIIGVIANIALALSVVIALIFGIAQVRQAARDRRERLTLETLRNFHSREFAELILYVTGREMPATRKELRALPDKDQVAFIQLSQQMESLGMLVAERLIDLDLVDKTLGSFVVTSWEKYRPVFIEMREKLPDPFLAEYFQWLAEHIAQRMRDNPRVPFYQAPEAPGSRAEAVGSASQTSPADGRPLG